MSQDTSFIVIYEGRHAKILRQRKEGRETGREGQERFQVSFSQYNHRSKLWAPVCCGWIKLVDDKEKEGLYLYCLVNEMKNNGWQTKTSKTDTSRRKGRPALRDALRDPSCSECPGILSFQGQISFTLKVLPRYPQCTSRDHGKKQRHTPIW